VKDFLLNVAATVVAAIVIALEGDHRVMAHRLQVRRRKPGMGLLVAVLVVAIAVLGTVAAAARR
jgi:hypothetical protein